MFKSLFNQKPERLSDAVKAESSELKPQIGQLPVYKVPLKDENIKIKGCRFFRFGELGKVAAKQSRTIMVLGATSAGKSTLINGMINYILGVKWSDSYRFSLVDNGETKSQAHSQTAEVTVYKLNHREGFQVPFSLTIIDTPGFGDTRGIDRDREITEQLRNLFTSTDGVSEIDAVCLVAQADLARLTPAQKYVFDSILSIFDKDIAENIRILVTFADGQKPPVLEAIKASGVPSPKGKDGLPVHFKFNNSALFADNKSSATDALSDDDDENFDQMFWNMGTKSMRRFFAALNQIETKSFSNKKPERFSDAVKAESSELKPQKGPLPVYRVPLKEENIKIKGCRFFRFGELGKVSAKQSRTIMVLGATSAGKSTLINGMINYILGVEFSDSYRFSLVDDGQTKSQAHSQTSEVTVYKLNHREGFQVPFSLTIIDTPGFGNTRGIDRDREITEQLRNLFTNTDGVSEIDAVCFVAQAALARLTPTQKYVFDSILSIFGKDIAENIRILVTFADGQKPPVLEAIKASGVPSPKGKDGLPVHFKFNNSALFADNKSSAADAQSDDDDENFDQMFWNMGTKSMKRFFAALNQIETKSLILTNEVLRERKQLEVSVENLQIKVKLGLAKLEEIRETREKIKEHEAEISRNEDFEFEVTVKKPIHIDISGTGNFITNCQQCHVTCHYPCGIPDDDGKRGCCAMDGNGNCTECPNKCHWNVHFNQKYRFDYKDVTEKRTVADLKENYEKATGKKMTVEGLMRELKAEYSIMQDEVNKLIDESAKCLNRLKEIALKPNPLTTPEYIDMLIEGEKQEAKLGWKQRVESLMTMKQKAEYMAKVEKGEKSLLKQESLDVRS